MPPIETPTVEESLVISPTETIETPAEPVSIADHAKTYSPKAQKAAEKAEPDLKPVRPVDQQKRADSGQFAEGQKRLKAKDAVERINQLTGRAKSAEERLVAAQAELAQLRATHAPALKVAVASRKLEQAETRATAAGVPYVLSAESDPEPKEDDAKFEGDYGKYLRAASQWDARQAVREDRAAAAAQTQQAQRQEARTTTLKAFSERLTTAGQQYGEDFEDTLRWDVPWLAKSGEPHPGYEAIDAFIKEDESGADVLHSLRSHPDEVDALMQMPPLQQVKRLTLLGQRFASSGSAEAGNTGSATRRPPVVVLPHRPPNPVRTEAQRAGETPPPLDGSLSIAEHRKAFMPARR